MYVLSDAIRNNKQRQAVSLGRFRVSFSWYVITFSLVALLSAYFQIVYAWIHAQPIPVNEGVSVYWQGVISPLVDARIVIVPLALPAIAILYALGGLAKPGTAKKETKETKETSPKVSQLSPVSVSKPETETPRLPDQPSTKSLPEPKGTPSQRVYEHLETFPDDLTLSVRKLAEKLEMPPATVYKAMKKYRDEQGGNG